MTGFASVSLALGEELRDQPAPPSVLLELRSVNGRFLELAFKLPEEYRALEPQLRELLTASLRRGKVELRLQGREAHSPQDTPLSAQQLQRLQGLQGQVLQLLPHARPLSVHEALTWCRSASIAPATALDTSALMRLAKQGVQALCEARRREGDKIAAALRERLQQLHALAARAQALVPEAVERQRQRYIERWQEALQPAHEAQPGLAEPLEQRALQEAAAYAMRIDVAEELSRLEAHLVEIEHLLGKGGELGKRLDFLVQELHREANTLGSKSSSLSLSAVSVDMRVLIEQMREMVQNIE